MSLKDDEWKEHSGMDEAKVEKAFMAVLGHPPRQADIAVCGLMTIGRTEDEAIEIVADYLWDHWLGEPNEPSMSEIERAVRKAVQG